MFTITPALSVYFLAVIALGAIFKAYFNRVAYIKARDELALIKRNVKAIHHLTCMLIQDDDSADMPRLDPFEEDAGAVLLILALYDPTGPEAGVLADAEFKQPLTTTLECAQRAHEGQVRRELLD